MQFPYPAEGTKCRIIWDWCDTVADAIGSAPSSTMAKASKRLADIDRGTIGVQLSKWRRHHEELAGDDVVVEYRHGYRRPDPGTFEFNVWALNDGLFEELEKRPAMPLVVKIFQILSKCTEGEIKVATVAWRRFMGLNK